MIISLARNGTLEWSNASPTYTYTVEWASGGGSEWHDSWGALKDLPYTGETMSIGIPMLFRIRATPAWSGDVTNRAWTTVASTNISPPNWGLATVEIDRKIYSLSENIGELVAYNVENGAWSTRKPLVNAPWGFHLATVNGVLYVIGGYQSAQVSSYDPAVDAWMPQASLPKAGFFMGSTVANDIYLFGGTPGGNAEHYSEVFRYDRSSNSWLTLSSMPAARFGAAVATAGSRVYIIGGLPRTGANAEATVWEYDTGTDTWSEKAKMPTPRIDAAASVIGDNIVVIGGWHTQAGQRVEITPAPVEVYSPLRNEWMRMKPVDDIGAYTVAVRGRICKLRASAHMKVYDLGTDQWVQCQPPAGSILGSKAFEFNDHLYVVSASGGLLRIESFNAGP